jgi:hypothetical protein
MTGLPARTSNSRGLMKVMGPKSRLITFLDPRHRSIQHGTGSITFDNPRKARVSLGIDTYGYVTVS